jgi:hypothetical protein
MKIRPSAVMALALLALMPLSHAATLEVTWGDPAKFRDIRASDDNQVKYQERVMKELEAQFQKEAVKLPADQKLKIDIKDLNLAGELEYFHEGFPFGLRVVRNVDFPSMKLSYELRDGKGQVLKSGDSDFNYMEFNSGIQVLQGQAPLHYELDMITKWYQRTL